MITEAEYITAKQIVLQYEKENSKTLFWTELVAAWFRCYNSRKGTDPNFTNGEQPALKRLIEKIRKKAVEAKLEWCSETATACLEMFLNKIDDKWIINNFTLRTIDSKFDSIYARAKGKSPAGQSADLDAQIAART